MFAESVQPEEISTVHVLLPPREKCSQEVNLFDSLHKPNFEAFIPEISKRENFVSTRTVIKKVAPEHF